MAWSGFGVNYKGLQANWSNDMAYFNSIGLTSIRPNLASLPYPWNNGLPVSSGNYAFWRLCAQTFSNAGFWVTWGPSSPNGMTHNNLGSALWANYAASVVAEATYCQSIGLTLGAFELGNELEAFVDGTTLTIPQLISNIGTLATQVKAVYNLSPISYSCYDTNGITYNTWLSTGLGGLDYLAIHPYLNYQNSGRSEYIGGFGVIAKMIYGLGANHCYISEFGLEAGNNNYWALYPDMALQQTRYIYQTIKNLGFPRALLYTYVGYLNEDNQFANRLLDNSLLQYWDVYVQDDRRFGNITTPIQQPIPIWTPSVFDTESETDVVTGITIH